MPLGEAIIAQREAKEVRYKAWRNSKLKKALIENLDDPKKTILGALDEEYPRLRCYRGQGQKLTLEDAFMREDSGCVVIMTDWVHRSVTIWDESEGCPGAPIKVKSHHIDGIPKKLFDDKTFSQSTFNIWARRERDDARDSKRKRLKEELATLKG